MKTTTIIIAVLISIVAKGQSYNWTPLNLPQSGVVTSICHLRTENDNLGQDGGPEQDAEVPYFNDLIFLAITDGNSQNISFYCSEKCNAEWTKIPKGPSKPGISGDDFRYYSFSLGGAIYYANDITYKYTIEEGWKESPLPHYDWTDKMYMNDDEHLSPAIFNYNRFPYLEGYDDLGRGMLLYTVVGKEKNQNGSPRISARHFNNSSRTYSTIYFAGVYVAGDKILASSGTNIANMFISFDQGKTWKSINIPSAHNGTYVKFYYDGKLNEKIFVATTNGLWYTPDFGDNWINITGNLTNYFNGLNIIDFIGFFEGNVFVKNKDKVWYLNVDSQ